MSLGSLVPRSLLFGAPLVLLASASLLMASSGRKAPLAAPVQAPAAPVAEGAILLVLQDHFSPPNAAPGSPPAGDGGGVAAAIAQAIGQSGHPVVDARVMWNDLVHGQAPLNAGQIDTPIPAWWPGALRSDWETGRALCEAKAGPPPYGITNLAAYLCGLHVAPVLWQRWLDHVRAEQVITVDIQRTNPNDPNHDGWNVEVSAYQPGSIDDHRLFRGELRPAAIEGAAADMAARAMRGEGRIIRRTLEREMPDSPLYHAHPAAAIPNDGIPVGPAR